MEPTRQEKRERRQRSKRNHIHQHGKRYVEQCLRQIARKAGK